MVKRYTLVVIILTIANTSSAGNTATTGRDNLQIAFVDSFKAMRECEEGRVVGQALEDMREKFSKEIQQDAQKIAKEESDLKTKASTLKPDVKLKEEHRITKLKRELEDAVREKEETIKITMQQKTEELAIKVEEGIVAVAKEKGVDAVIDKMTGRVMYTKDDNTGDITSEAISFVNKKAVTVASKKEDKTRSAAAA